MCTPHTVEVSVLRWAPPIVHGLVRDLRVRWALEEAGWPYREHVVSREDQQSAAYRARQPFGQVPALRSDELALFESGAIVLHIAERSPKLMPAEPAARAQVTSWIFAALNTIEPPLVMINAIDMLYQGPKGPDVQGLRSFVVGWAEQKLDDLVRVLGDGEYLVGRFSAADVLLSTVLRILRDTDLVEKRPILAAYHARCEARPAFQKAFADHVANFARHSPPGPGQ